MQKKNNPQNNWEKECASLQKLSLRSWNDTKSKRWEGLIVTRENTWKALGWRKISHGFCWLLGKCSYVLKHGELWKGETLFCSLGLRNICIGRFQSQITRKDTIPRVQPNILKGSAWLSVTCNKKVIGETSLNISFYFHLENQRN